jgi:hypothetical protein
MKGEDDPKRKGERLVASFGGNRPEEWGGASVLIGDVGTAGSTWHFLNLSPWRHSTGCCNRASPSCTKRYDGCVQCDTMIGLTTGVYAIQFNDGNIWGATAGILRNLWSESTKAD